MLASKILCAARGHLLEIRKQGSRVHCVCVRCGLETPGWLYGEPASAVAGSQAYWEAAYAEFVDTELSLHGGG